MLEQLELVREEMKNGRIGEELARNLERMLKEYDNTRGKDDFNDEEKED